MRRAGPQEPSDGLGAFVSPVVASFGPDFQQGEFQVPGLPFDVPKSFTTTHKAGAMRQDAERCVTV